jgi:UDP-N-acetylenolpyruvoylglucosamine reductase
MLEKNITKIDFIKLDVEGFEYFVLAGGSNIIVQSKPLMFIELDDSNMRENNKSAKELIDLLISFGYKEIYRADNLMPVTSHNEFNNCHYDIIAK